MIRVWFRRSVVTGALCVAAAVLTMAAGDLWVRGAAHGHVYSAAAVPAAPVASTPSRRHRATARSMW